MTTECGTFTLCEIRSESFRHIVITELGFANGETPVTEQAIDRAVRERSGRFWKAKGRYG